MSERMKNLEISFLKVFILNCIELLIGICGFTVCKMFNELNIFYYAFICSISAGICIISLTLIIAILWTLNKHKQNIGAREFFEETFEYEDDTFNETIFNTVLSVLLLLLIISAFIF